MFVPLKVFKLIGPSNDGRRHGRGTYLLALELLFPHYNTFVTPQVFQMTAEGTVGAPTCLSIVVILFISRVSRLTEN
jgi:hypothetical protein